MDLIKKIFIVLVFILNLFSKELEPTNVFIASGGVTDLVINENRLFVATASSSVDIFQINSKEKIDSIKIPKIKDFMGNEIDSKIYSIDVIENKILILSQGEKGGRNIFLYENEKLTNLIKDEQRLFIAQAKFLDESHIIYSLLSNQIYLFDMRDKTIKNEIQISQSKFSNFKLSEDKNRLIVCDESGILTMIDTKTFQVIKILKDENLDNVFQVDFKNNIVLTAGQDRRSAIYNQNTNESYYKEFEFLVYSAGLSPSGNLAAVSSDEENNVTIFNTKTKEDLFKLIKNKSTLTNIVFINENEILVSSDANEINYYKIIK